MAVYAYKAKKNNAETVSGKINAHTEDEALDLIHQLGFLPVSVQLDSQEQIEQTSASGKRIKTSEIYVFSRQLSNLLKSGVSILRGLNIIEEQTENIALKAMVGEIIHNVKGGKSLSQALGQYPNSFSSLYITMVKAGEESGNLQQMLLSIAQYQKKEEELIRKVKTALAYPLLMGVLGIGTIYFILTYVLPKMSGLFESLGDSLPLPTVILLNISDFFNTYWFLFLIIIAGGLFFLQRWRHTQKGDRALSRYMLHIPLFGNIVLKSEIARFSRSLVLLMNSGVSVVRSLEISIPILSNAVIKNHLTKCKEDLLAGGSFGESIKESDEIPSMMGHLISIGEESGNLTEILEEIADSYESETNEQIKIITTLLEPILILVVGLIIGFIVFAILLPIFSIDILAK